MLDLLLIEWARKMKLGSNSILNHPQLNHNYSPLNGALIYAGSLWPLCGNLDCSFLHAILIFPP
jgi:hypothetical protein